MTEQVKIDLQDNSPYRVALDLAYTIAKAESKLSTLGHAPEGDRKYWLDLYARSLRVVRGSSAEQALKGGAEPQSSLEPDAV